MCVVFVYVCVYVTSIHCNTYTYINMYVKALLAYMRTVPININNIEFKRNVGL